MGASVFLALVLMPWGLPEAALSTRERVAAAAYWVLGLLAFGIAGRAMLVWWMLVAPWFAMVVERFSAAPKGALVVRAQLGAVALIALSFAAGQLVALRRDRASYGGAARDMLLRYVGVRVEPIAAWLECRTGRHTGGLIFTVFHLGSYLAWRLPTYSSSIDGRNIFPDSVARAEAYTLPWKGPLDDGPWESADLAISTLDYPAAAALDSAAGWRRVATVDVGGPYAKYHSVGLWVSERWWARVGVLPLPARPTLLRTALAGKSIGDCSSTASVSARPVALAPLGGALEAFPR